MYQIIWKDKEFHDNGIMPEQYKKFIDARSKKKELEKEYPSTNFLITQKKEKESPKTPRAQAY